MPRRGSFILLKRSKAANKLKEAGFCCFCQVPNETLRNQRQQTSSRKQDFAASAKCPMKLTKVKGSKQASGSRILLLLPWTQSCSKVPKAADKLKEAGFCCFCPGPNLARKYQRQQICQLEANLVAFDQNRILVTNLKGSRFVGWRPIQLPLPKMASWSQA